MSNWDELKQWIEKYRKDHTQSNNWDEFGRYCVAISCDELLDKMNEIESKNRKF